MKKQGDLEIGNKPVNLASILLTNWNTNNPFPDNADPLSPIKKYSEAIQVNRASRYLLPQYKSNNSQNRVSLTSKEQGGLRYDLILNLFQTTDSNAVNSFTKIFTFGVEMDIWRKGRTKKCRVFLDQHVPTLIWVSSQTKAFLFDIAYSTFSRFDGEFEVYSPSRHYIVLRYFQEQLPLLLSSQDEVQRYYDLFVNYRNYHRVKNQYPPYFSKLIKYYTLAEMTSDYKRSKTVSDILKIASKISGAEREEEYMEIVKELISAREVGFLKNNQSIKTEEVVLRDEEVMEFMKIASCNQNIKAIFQNYAHIAMQTKLEYTVPLMEIKQFKRFLIEEQHQPLNSIDKIISNFVHISNPYDSIQKSLSFYQFCSYCCRIDTNYIVYQPELNRKLPITDYFIWSSHNTYLSGNQLTSDSKVERYLQDLNDGIKCVEIDVHDSGNTPIVTHALKGIYLNRSVTFEEVIRAISLFCRKNEGFDPIILSIQNHTSQQNRYTMVNIIFKYLQKYLFTLQDENMPFQSSSVSQKSSNTDNKNQIGALELSIKCRTLAELRGKVIIKTDSSIQNILNQKRRKPHKASFSVNLNVCTSMQQPKYFPIAGFNLRFKEYENMVRRMQDRKEKFIVELPCNYFQNMGDQMARVTGLFKNHQGVSNPNPLCYQCISLTNKALKKMLIADSQNYTKKSFMRIYPVGTEVASGNYNPIHGLQRGAQIIAINTQTKDDYAWLMMSYFTAGRDQEAKNIGFVEKPQYLKSSPKLQKTGSLNIEGVKRRNDFKKMESAAESTVPRNSFQLIFHPSNQMDFSKRVELSILTTCYEVRVKFFGTDLDMERNRGNQYCFNIEDYNEAFFMFQIGDNLKECVPVRFLREGYRVIAGRNNNYNDCGVRILVKVKIKQIES